MDRGGEAKEEKRLLGSAVVGPVRKTTTTTMPAVQGARERALSFCIVGDWQRRESLSP